MSQMIFQSSAQRIVAFKENISNMIMGNYKSKQHKEGKEEEISGKETLKFDKRIYVKYILLVMDKLLLWMKPKTTRKTLRFLPRPILSNVLYYLKPEFLFCVSIGSRYQ